MLRSVTCFAWFVVLMSLGFGLVLVYGSNEDITISRDDFPPGFVFGAASSAYQIEGAADEDGRTPSIWDTFAHSGYMHGATGDVACDGYHKYKEDVQLMTETSLEAYRFSISWSRLIPKGRGPINPKGLQFYNNFINELVTHGIEPHVTLHHVDLPQVLEDEYGGWLSKHIVEDFTAYADVCFGEFGDRVKHWTTMNEANVFVLGGYDVGILPPHRCSPLFTKSQCSVGNSSTEPYIVAHHILLSHASAARLYERKYKDKQNGLIGINVLSYWFVPLTDSDEDIIATQRANDFYLGWFLNPLVFGDYPDIVKKNAGSRIPTITAKESKSLKGSFDFLGLNYYHALYVKDISTDLVNKDVLADMGIQKLPFINGSSIFEYPIQPWGLVGVVEYIKQHYNNPIIYIHENGQSTRRNSTLEDWPRVHSLQAHIGSLLGAIRNGSDVRGYFTWSFMDLFELLDGYESGYGLYYVDLDDPDLRRQPKLSSKWYSNFLKGRENITLISDELVITLPHFSFLEE